MASPASRFLGFVAVRGFSSVIRPWFKKLLTDRNLQGRLPSACLGQKIQKMAS